MIRASYLLITLSLFLSACSTLNIEAERTPSNDSQDCHELARFFVFKDEFQEGLQKALIEKKLLTYGTRFVTVQHPKLDWINRTRISLNKSIKNWNNNKHPAFYIFNDEEVVPEAKEYFETISTMIVPDMAVAPHASQNLETVNKWIKSFESYQKDLNDLLDERISLQYNLSMLKKVKIKGESVDVKLSYKRDGKVVEEIVTLRKADKDQGYYIKKLKAEIADLDGSLFKNGKIKDRIIRQAMLMDMITIVQREFEYGVKNADYSDPELSKELNRLNSLLKNSEFTPTTYGVYRITNQVFIRELIALSKLDVAYKKFVGNPIEKIKEILTAFIQNRPVNVTEQDNTAEKIGVLKRIYNKISNITAKQAAVTGGVAVVGGIGYQHYFMLKGSTVTEIEKGDQEVSEQLEKTKEEELERVKEHSEVIEIEVDELTK